MFFFSFFSSNLFDMLTTWQKKKKMLNGELDSIDVGKSQNLSYRKFIMSFFLNKLKYFHLF